MNSEMLDAALSYAARGWRVLKLHGVVNGQCTCGNPKCGTSTGKHPNVGTRWETKATINETTIRRWFGGTDACNIGIMTGRASGLVVVDVDDEEAYVEAQAMGLPDTLAVSTGRGKHFLYRHPGDDIPNGAKLFGLNIDVRGDGGQIVAPPSTHYSGRVYRWDNEIEPAPLPEWVTLREPVPAPSKTGGMSLVGIFDEKALDWDRVVDALSHLDPDMPEKEWAKVGMMLHSTGDARAFDTWDSWSSRGTKYPDTKTLRDKHWPSFKKSGLTVASLFKLAQDAGWRPSRSFPVVTTPPPAPRVNDDPGQIPEHLLSVPGFVNDVVDVTLASQPYPCRPIAFAGALALQGFLASRKVATEDGARSSLYIVGLAPSGVGKQGARTTNQKILTAIRHEDALFGALASGEGAEDAMTIVRAALFQPDEVDSLVLGLADDKQPAARRTGAILMDLFTSAATTYVGRVRAFSQKKPGKKGEEDDAPIRPVIHQPGMSLFGCCLASRFYSALNESLATNGFLSRCLLIESGRREKRHRFREFPIPDHVLDHAATWKIHPCGLGDLSDTHPAPRVVPYSDEAYEALEEARDRFDALYDNATDEVHRVQWTRAGEKAVRLALVAACSASVDCQRIDVGHIRWAVDLVTHCTRRTLHMVDGNLSANPFDALCLKVLSAMRERGGEGTMKRYEIVRLLRVPADDVTKVLATMVERGDIVAADQSTTGGRPPSVFRVAK